MPTPQGYVGNNVKFVLGNNDLSGIGNKISLSIKQNTIDVTTFGNLWMRVITGLSSFSLKYDGIWKYDTGTGDVVLFGLFGYLDTTVSYTLNLLNRSGAPSYSGNMILTDYNPSTDVKSAIIFSASLQGDGIPVRGVVA